MLIAQVLDCFFDLKIDISRVTRHLTVIQVRPRGEGFVSRNLPSEQKLQVPRPLRSGAVRPDTFAALPGDKLLAGTRVV